jgi:hypothetical protein
MTNNQNINLPPSVSQPPVQCYNPVQIMWTDVECEYLLNQRMARNDEYWGLTGGGRRRFWRSVARKINECFGTRFTGEQCKNKWKNLKSDYQVNIFYINLLYYFFNF